MKVTDTQKQQIAKEYLGGASLEEIREIFGVSTGNIARVLRGEQIPVKSLGSSGRFPKKGSERQKMSKLAEEVLSEQDLMELLDVTRDQLDYLRLEKNFPCVYLGQRVRIYMADEVLKHLKQALQKFRTDTD